MNSVIVLSVFAIYYACGLLGIELAAANTQPLSLIWLPAGVGISALLLAGPRLWPVIWLASFAANTPYLYISTADSLPMALLVGAGAASCDSIEALLGYYLFSHFVGLRAFERGHGVFAFALLVGLIPATLSMLALSSLYAATNNLPGGAAFAEVWMAYSLADLHGIIIIAPITIAFLLEQPSINWHRTRRWLFMGLLLAIVQLASLQWPQVIYLLLPLLVWVALSHSLFGTTIINALCFIGLSVITAHGVGPFAGNEQWNAFLHMLLFNLSTGFTIIFLAAQQRNLAISQQNLEQQVQERTAALQTANRRLSELAATDELTGAMNRRSFFARANAELMTSRRLGFRLCAMIVDLDHFKEINDHFGHVAGDLTLRCFYQCCRAELRHDDLIGRIGGEEFAILLPQTDFAHGIQVAEKLRRAVQFLVIDYNGQRIALTISIGVAEVTEDLDTALRLADNRLYEAKHRGRNRISIGT